MAGLNFYDLQPLQIARNFFNFTDVNTGKNILIAFCDPLPENLWCNNKPSLAVLQDENLGTCTTLAGSDPTTNAVFSVQN
jgi:hypothetical protein